MRRCHPLDHPSASGMRRPFIPRMLVRAPPGAGSIGPWRCGCGCAGGCGPPARLRRQRLVRRGSRKRLRRHAAGRDRPILAHVRQPDAVVPVRLAAPDSPHVPGVEELDLQAGLLWGLEGRLPEDAGTLRGGRGDGVPEQPRGQIAQPKGQGAELARGAQGAGHAGLAQALGGRHLHPVDVEPRDAGTEDFQGVVVETVRHGPLGRSGGLCRNRLTSRRKRGR